MPQTFNSDSIVTMEKSNGFLSPSAGQKGPILSSATNLFLYRFFYTGNCIPFVFKTFILQEL